MENKRPDHCRKAFKQLGYGLSAVFLGTTLTLAAHALPADTAIAAEFPTAFATALKLARAEATYDRINFYPSAYQFAIRIPAAATQSLARVSITVPNEFGAFGVDMPKQENISAFIPTEPDAMRPQVAQRVLPTQINIDGRMVLIDFLEPIPADQTVTIQFALMRNPSLGGTYLFEVNAFPPGSKAVKQFVGYGRLVFRENRGFR